jgi:hypothetical protein
MLTSTSLQHHIAVCSQVTIQCPVVSHVSLHIFFPLSTISTLQRKAVSSYSYNDFKK